MASAPASDPLPISIHVPRVEDDFNVNSGIRAIIKFQSTSPVWRTTRCRRYDSRRHKDFNPRPPVWRTTYAFAPFFRGILISIHVPRVEDDRKCERKNKSSSKFQSTSPVWRTTEGDAQSSPAGEDFNPRPPCGGRLLYTCVYVNSFCISIHVPRVEDDRACCGVLR